MLLNFLKKSWKETDLLEKNSKGFNSDMFVFRNVVDEFHHQHLTGVAHLREVRIHEQQQRKFKKNLIKQ